MAFPIAAAAMALTGKKQGAEKKAAADAEKYSKRGVARANAEKGAEKKESKTLTRLQEGSKTKLQENPLFDDGGRLASAIEEINNLQDQADPLANPIRQTATNSVEGQARTNAFLKRKAAEEKAQMANAITARNASNKKRASDKPNMTSRLRLRTL